MREKMSIVLVGDWTGREMYEEGRRVGVKVVSLWMSGRGGGVKRRWD